MRRITFGKIVAMAAVLGSPAWCGTISGLSGQILLLTMPGSLQPNIFENDSDAAVFPEQNGVTLSSDLPVDALATGTYDLPSRLTPGVIAAGTVVSDVLFHSDPVQSTGTRFSGSITFNADILAVIALSNTLTATDSIFGLPGVDYPATDRARGLELNPGNDQFSILADRRTLTFSVMTWQDIDQMRIITASAVNAANVEATPEPGTCALLIPGLAGFLWFRRRTLRDLRRSGARPPASVSGCLQSM